MDRTIIFRDNIKRSSDLRYRKVFRAVSKLEPDERATLNLLTDGCSLIRIAAKLGLPLEKTYQLKSSLMKKLNANSTADLVRVGILAQAKRAI